MTSPAPAPRSILVVDDDRLVLATLTHGLAQAGYRVLDADNGDDAILLAREHHPDLALLDIRMQGRSGFDVAAYLREYCTGTPFLFLSAFSDEETIAQVRSLGAVAYLVKPLDIGQILPVIANALEQARPAHPDAATGASPVPGSGAGATLAATAPEVLVAVGVLMHRYSLSRARAHGRLQQQAHAEGRSLQAQAMRVLDAIEALAPPPSPQSD